jgi:hypothetical protein
MQRKTIFGKIFGGITNVAAGAVGSAIGLGNSLQNLGIGAKGTPGIIESAPLALNLEPEGLNAWDSPKKSSMVPFALAGAVLLYFITKK